MRNLVAALALLGIPGIAVAAGAKCPDVLVVLDASNSMSSSPGGGVTDSKITIAREVIREVLLGDSDAGVAAADARIRFGYSYFPDGNCTAAPANPLPVPLGFGTEAAIADTVDAQVLHGSTPTAEALEAAKSSPDLQDASRQRYVLLVTDGVPTCGNDAGGRAIGAVADLYAAGVQSFVVGFGTEAASAQRTLSGMAAQGQPMLSDGGAALYYQADDSASLASALSTILAQTGGELGGASCDPCADAQCTSSQKCVLNGAVPSCVADPCHANTCTASQFCVASADGGSFTCEGACTSGCPTGETCNDGTCVTDPCANGGCGTTCPTGEAREIDGGCGADPCAKVQCPFEAPVCKYGSCSGTPTVDAGPHTSGSTGGGSGSSGATTGAHSTNVGSSSGCACGAVDGAALLGVFSLASLFRRRARR